MNTEQQTGNKEDAQIISDSRSVPHLSSAPERSPLKFIGAAQPLEQNVR